MIWISNPYIILTNNFLLICTYYCTIHTILLYYIKLRVNIVLYTIYTILYFKSSRDATAICQHVTFIIEFKKAHQYRGQILQPTGNTPLNIYNKGSSTLLKIKPKRDNLVHFYIYIIHNIYMIRNCIFIFYVYLLTHINI